MDPSLSVLRVGLTGGIASGKTTAANAFAELGAAVIDTDDLAREVTQPGSDGLEAIVQTFGSKYLDAVGRLDRARLRQRVFASGEDRERLEAIVHPLVLASLERRLERLDAPYAIIVVPLLVETGMHRDMDRVVVIDCPEAVQIERLGKRDGETETGARAILASQAERATRLAAGDDILVNDADLIRLAADVRKLHDSYLRMAARQT